MEKTRRSFLIKASTASLALLLGQCRRSGELQSFTDSETIDSHWSGIGFGIEMSAEWYGVRSESVVMQFNAMIEQTIRQLEVSV